MENSLSKKVQTLWNSSSTKGLNKGSHWCGKCAALQWGNLFPVVLKADPSDDAIGGVLLPNDQPACFTSHTLYLKEKNYAHIKKESLAAVSCMDK